MKDYSFGIVPIDNQNPDNPLYLLVEQGGEFWSLPKGHAEMGESPVETAKREFFEETGLSFQEIWEDVQFIEHYFWKDKDVLMDKTVTFFPAFVSGEPLIDNKEITGWKWLPFAQAIKTVTYPETKKVLEEAHEWLTCR